MDRSYDLTVAAVQFAPEVLKPRNNLARMGQFVAEAQARGARLVVLPELSTTGYYEHPDLHSFAEHRVGYTVQTLVKLSQRYGVYIAAGFEEFHQDDIYDSLAFTTPRGEVSIYRKRHLIFWEHFYFRGGCEPLIVETEIGRIGFAICADMMYRSVWNNYRGKIDLAVVSAAWPRATEKTRGQTGWLFHHSDELTEKFPTQIASEYEIPVVVSNQTGPCQVRIPLMGRAQPAEFSGKSAVYDHTGRKVSAGLPGEGIAIGHIQIPRDFASWSTLSG